MATSKPPHGKPPNENMRLAYEAVRSGSLTIYGAAKTFSVPRTTLSDKIRGLSSLTARKGRPTSLSDEEEKSLVSYIEYMSEHGFPLTREQVIYFALAVDRKKPDDEQCFGENGPSLNWWHSFKQRHPSLTLRRVETKDKSRVESSESSKLNQYFDLLEP